MQPAGGLYLTREKTTWGSLKDGFHGRVGMFLLKILLYRFIPGESKAASRKTKYSNPPVPVDGEPGTGVNCGVRSSGQATPLIEDVAGAR